MKYEPILSYIPMIIVSTMVEDQEHPQKLMKDSGLTYIHAVPQSLYDCWVFFGVENTKSIRLPEWAAAQDCRDATIYIGNGLAKGEALRINDWISEKINGNAKALTVSELIKELELLPGGLKVMVQAYEGGYTPLSKFRVYGRHVTQNQDSSDGYFGEYDETPGGELVVTFDRG